HAPLAPQIGQLAGRHGGGEADHAIVGGVDLEQEPGLGPYRLRVVLEMSTVGRTDLTQCRARSAHDIGDAELATYLDQLSARNDHFLAAREALEREQDRRCAV